MINRKIVLAVALLIGTTTVAPAESAVSAKRYPMRAGATQPTSMRVDQNRNMSLPSGNLMMNVMDRASSPFACGG